MVYPLIPEDLIGELVPSVNNKKYYVYIMASKRDGMMYIGVTSNLLKRVYEHKNDLVDGFSHKYHIHNLVHFEIAEDIRSAISREKRLKKWNRAWKITLIEKITPNGGIYIAI
jgi:putative endonuclease